MIECLLFFSQKLLVYFHYALVHCNVANLARQFQRFPNGKRTGAADSFGQRFPFDIFTDQDAFVLDFFEAERFRDGWVVKAGEKFIFGSGAVAVGLGNYFKDPFQPGAFFAGKENAPLLIFG